MTNNSFYAQYEEDKVLAHIFCDKKQGFYIDIGAYDGITGSNSKYFDNIGWAGICIEPIIEHCNLMKKDRKNTTIINAAISDNHEPKKVKFLISKKADTLSSLSSGKESKAQLESSEIQEVDCYSMNYLLASMKPNIPEIDFISIDVEGYELDVLKGLNLNQYQPRVLIVEDIYEGINHQVERFLRRFQYKLFMRSGCNDWYIKNSDEIGHDIYFNPYKKWLKKVKNPINARINYLRRTFQIKMRVKKFFLKLITCLTNT